MADHNLPPFENRFLLPAFWPTWALLGLLRLLMYMPRGWVMAFGALIGDQFRKRNRKRRRIVEVNLDLCFPELSDEARRQMCIDHFRAYGRSLADMGLSIWGSEKMIRRLVSMEGLDEHIEQMKEGPILVIIWHMTTLEVSANALSFVGPSVSMMNKMKNPLLTWQSARGRVHLTDVVLVNREAGMRPLIRELRKGRQCALLPDEDLGLRDDTVFHPFFGVQRAFLPTPSRLARVAKARVAVCATILDPQTGRYRFQVSPPLIGVDGSDPEKDTGRIVEAMEELIRQAPEQYIWTFRWFRTRPEGAVSPYDPVPAA